MFTDREQKLINWLRKRKIATMRQLRHQFQVSHMTVFRALKKHGYHTSYNHNAAFYTPADIPQFDDWGLWAYRDVRFSRTASAAGNDRGLGDPRPRRTDRRRVGGSIADTRGKSALPLGETRPPSTPTTPRTPRRLLESRGGAGPSAVGETATRTACRG